MNHTTSPPRLTRTQKGVLYALFLLALGVGFLCSAEWIARAKGIQPWNGAGTKVSVVPGGRFFAQHPTLGYAHLPGHFTVTLTDGYTFVATHGTDALRITQPTNRASSTAGLPEIWIFGCSFTHGWSLNDDETYPWLLQQRFSGHRIVNFGVSGYGTIHSLIQFREALAHRKPALAVLTYASFHDERNTFARTRRKTVAVWSRLGTVTQPYARLGRDDALQFLAADNVEYREFPLMRHLAVSHYLEMAWSDCEQKRLRSHEVSEALVLEIAALASSNAVKLLVASIAEDGGMQSFSDRHGIPHADISVDLEAPGNRNLPHDRHPSAAANRMYAAKLEAAIHRNFPELH